MSMTDTTIADLNCLRIDGKASIAQASQLQKSLSAALASSPNVLIDCQASEIDVSVIQLLIAAGHAAQKSGGELRLKEVPTGAVLDALLFGGFLNGAKDRVATKPGLWAKGGRL
jgi:anti-anti-sigma regulatory factor